MDFRTLQYRFAAHLRDPARNPAPEGLEERRLAVYRELFFGNLSALLASAFPVLHRILPPADWQRLVRGFFAGHRARTPHFPELPGEFLDHLEARGVGPGDPPFLIELARHEWTELELQTAPDAPPDPAVDPDADLLATSPVLSPLVRAAGYAFPVHRLSPEFQPAAPPAEPTWLVTYRDRADRIVFLQVNLATARLIELIAADDGRSGAALIAQLAGELGVPAAERFEQSGRRMLEDLRARGILSGGRRRREARTDR